MSDWKDLIKEEFKDELQYWYYTRVDGRSVSMIPNIDYILPTLNRDVLEVFDEIAKMTKKETKYEPPEWML